MSSPTYNWDRWQLGSPSEYLEWIHRLVILKKPLSILEVGLGPGASTVSTLLATQERGIVVNTIDINPPPRSIERVEELVHPGKRWNLMYGDSPTIMEMLPAESFDYIYIDGDHSEEGVYRDAVAAYALLAPGGTLVFDDAGAPEFTVGVNAGIKRALVGKKDLVEEFLDLDVINPNGPRVFRRLTC